MSCSRDTKEGSYDFFDDALEYIKKSDKAESEPISDLYESDIALGEDNTCCQLFSENWKPTLETINAKTICKQFIYLYNSLSHIKSKSIDIPDYKKDSSFVNYWVNKKISPDRSKNKSCVHDFSNKMETHCNKSFVDVKLPNLLYDIKEDDFIKIDILYNLYVNFDNLKSALIDLSESNTASVSYSNICCKIYELAKSIHNGQNTTFYKKLTNFTSMYKDLYPTFEKKEKQFSIHFKRLPDENKIIITSVLGSLVGLIPFLGVLYKFTPFGQFFRSKNKIISKEYSNKYDERISLHQDRYNIKYHSAG